MSEKLKLEDEIDDLLDSEEEKGATKKKPNQPKKRGRPTPQTKQQNR